MEDNKKKIYINKKVILVAVIALLISIITPVSYAFFTSTVIGNTNANNSVVQSGTMRLVFTDGNVIGTTTNWIPGDYITKSFTVENTGTLETSYSVLLEDVVNTFADTTDLVYTITGTTNGSNAAYTNATETQAPSVDTKIINNVLIASGETHSYTVTLKFLNKNENQDDNQNKSFTAKIQVYDVNNEPNLSEPLVNKIKSLKTSSINDLAYDGIETLGELGTTDNNLRYIGVDPNNYVYFNCSTINPSEMNDSTCEKWRIIGVFNNIEKENKSTETLVKIIRSKELGTYSFDSSDYNVNAGGGINQWGESKYTDGTPYEGADIMRELNTDYLGYITVGTDGKWFSGSNNKKTSMPSSTLNNNAQSMIETVKWNTGSEGDNSYTTFTAHNMYIYERSNNVGCLTSCSDNVVRTPSWIGKIGLMYPSDYGYAINDSNDSTKRITCLSNRLNDYNYWRLDSTYSCATYDWLYFHDKNGNFSKLTITPYPSYSNRSSGVFQITNAGDLFNPSSGGNELYIFPTLYLKSSVRFDSGDGSSTNPYKLTM